MQDKRECLAVALARDVGQVPDDRALYIVARKACQCEKCKKHRT